ncbi:MAG: hypothetical protein ACKOZX_11070, partial [Gammaproteobacteria bacterium]
MHRRRSRCWWIHGRSEDTETDAPTGAHSAARRARPARSIATSTTFTTTRRTTMIGYITLGTNNLAAARAFYDALLGEIGA